MFYKLMEKNQFLLYSLAKNIGWQNWKCDDDDDSKNGCFVNKITVKIKFAKQFT